MVSRRDTRLRILFSARPEFGHLYPMMPLVRAARDAGHSVVFATGEGAVPRVRALGIEVHEVGVSIVDAYASLLAEDPAVASPTDDGRPDLEVGGRLFIDFIARRTAEDLLPLLDRLRPDMVIYEQYDFGAGVAAAVAGLPAIGHSISRTLDRESRQRAAGSRLDRLWSDYGHASAPFDAFAGETFLDIIPPSLQEPSALRHPARIPMRPVAWAEPGTTLPSWVTVNRSRPLVYLTLGTIPGDSVDVWRAAIAGLSALDVDVLVALGPHDRSALGEVPASVHVERFVNQAAVLSHVDLVVHHGGSGTMLGALAQGVPQLLLPQGADQFTNADIVSEAGLGLALAPEAVTTPGVAESARALLNEASYRKAGHAARAEIAAMAHPVEVMAALAQRLETAA